MRGERRGSPPRRAQRGPVGLRGRPAAAAEVRYLDAARPKRLPAQTTAKPLREARPVDFRRCRLGQPLRAVRFDDVPGGGEDVPLRAEGLDALAVGLPGTDV